MNRERIARLAGFLEPLSDPDLQFMEDARSVPSAQATLIIAPMYAPIVDNFMDVCIHDGWMMKGLNWPEWIRGEEALTLLQDADAMAVATLEQISMLLTALLRQERFSDGTLHEAYKSGLLVRILRRVAALAD